MTRYGFFPAAGTDYTSGDEPTLAAALNRLGQSLRLHLIGISGARTPAHSVAVGGSANDPHTQGEASDTPGIESVPEQVLNRFGLTRPFGGPQEADHVQLLSWTRATGRATQGAGVRGTRSPGRQTGGFTLADYWTQGGGARNLAPIMAAIGMAESGGRIDAVNGPNDDGSYDYGWLQINSSHGYDRAKLLSDPVYTARAGVAIERAQGLSAWTTYTSGAYKTFLSSGGSYMPTFGRTRPGGDTSGQDDPVTSEFASYEENAGLWIPGPAGIPIPANPLDLFKGAAKAISGTTDFLKWIAWIFHPRNILRAVEFVTGLTLMGIGIHAFIENQRGGNSEGPSKTRKLAGNVVAATPLGREIRVAKGARAGKQATKAAKRRKEYESAYKRGKKGETRRSQLKDADKRFGKDAPF